MSSFNELLSLTNKIYNAEYTNDDGETFTIRDFCFSNGYGYCVAAQHPLAFFETYSSSMYDLSAVTSDAQIVAKVQTGRSVKIAGGYFYFPIRISGLFGETTPSTVTQNSATDVNDITAANATRISLQVKTTSEESLRNWVGLQTQIYKAVEEFNDASTILEAGLSSGSVINHAMLQNIFRSAGAITAGLVLMGIYSFVVLAGGCGPVRCRCNVGWLAMLTLPMSLMAGCGLAITITEGVRFVSFSFLLIYVIISLGLTYMFLISKTIDSLFLEIDDVPLLM